MKFNKNEIITVNEKEYIISTIVEENGNTYLYLISAADNNDDVSIVKVNENDGVVSLGPIDDDDEFKNIYTKIIFQNKDLIEKIDM